MKKSRYVSCIGHVKWHAIRRSIFSKKACAVSGNGVKGRSSLPEPEAHFWHRVFALRGLESHSENHDQNKIDGFFFQIIASIREQSRVPAHFLERRRLVVVAWNGGALGTHLHQNGKEIQVLAA